MSFTGLFQHNVPIDGGLSSPAVNVGDQEIRIVIGKGIGPQKLARRAVERKYSSAFSYIDHDVSFLAPRNIRIDPFQKFGVGADLRS